LDGLEGQPLVDLYAVGTQINNISALKNTQLRQLWLTESPVSDFSPLAGLPLVSLTAHRTLLENLSFVRKLPLIQRLHIGETLVTDLSPLAGLNLTRLVFSPEKIEQGFDVAKSLSNIREIGTKFDDKGKDLTTPDIFWAQF
jgi:Leucine-rich repeat (LRR) protein